MKRSCEAMERRALKRNIVQLPSIAVVRAKPTIILGQIQDISLGGLSFTYYMYSALQHKEASKLDILLPGEKYYLNGLPFTTVSDSVIPKENPFSMITMIRRGVRFSQLTPRQMFQLEELIHKVSLIRSIPVDEKIIRSDIIDRSTSCLAKENRCCVIRQQQAVPGTDVSFFRCQNHTPAVHDRTV